MKLRRLLRMSGAELAGRGRQEATKRLERLTAGTVGWRHGERLSAHVRRLLDGTAGAAASARRDPMREPALRRFFAGAADPRVPGSLERHDADAVVALADGAAEGRFHLLGYRDLSFGTPIDWHLDPVAGRRAPLVHWSRLDPLDRRQVGDSKVVWELNRHQWVVGLAQAYRITGNERFARAAIDRLHDWIHANPRGMGISWTSSLEVALRLISWAWVIVLLCDAAAMSSDVVGTIVAAAEEHALHVERYLSRFFSPNTHLTGEALGLFYAGTVFPELHRSGRWRALGRQILVAELDRQVLPDGAHFELSTCYQRYMVETYLHFVILADRTGVPLPPSVAERTQRMLDVLLVLRRPDGSIPAIGDADGGALLPLARRAPDDARGLFSTAAVLFNRRDYAWAAGALAPETLWLLGAESRRAFATLDPRTPDGAASRLVPDGGWAVLRSGWEPDGHQLVLDVGRLGCSVSSGHGHADLLAVECSALGEPIIVDPGTFCYTADPAWRDFFRGTGAHSTVMVDGVPQATPAGAFAWAARPHARLRGWHSTLTTDFADAEHDAYTTLADPVMHRRRVLFVKPRFWVIVDDLTGRREHRIDVRFQFAPAIAVTIDGRWTRATGTRGGLLLRAFAPREPTATLVEGQLEPRAGWVSHDYGRRVPAPALTYTAIAPLPLRIVTLVVPIRAEDRALPSVVPTDGGTSGLSLTHTGDRIVIDGDVCRREPGGA